MADKFTRLDVTDGDVFYADSNSNDSVEELEDNIDNKMLAYIGSDLTPNSCGSGIGEQIIGQVTIPANSVNTTLIIIASIRSYLTDASGSAPSGTFKVRVGNAGTTSDGQIGGDHLHSYSENSDSSSHGRFGGCLVVAAIAGTDFTASEENYVTITGTLTTGVSSSVGYCDSVVVLGA